jgi:hypothetical protein
MTPCDSPELEAKLTNGRAGGDRVADVVSNISISAAIAARWPILAEDAAACPSRSMKGRGRGEWAYATANAESYTLSWWDLGTKAEKLASVFQS